MQTKKIKIVFLLPSLVAGGAERVMSFVAQNLDKNHFDVSLLVIGYEKDTAYTINSIPITYLNQSRVLKGTPKVFQFFIKSRPDIVVSCMSHVNILAAFVLMAFPKIKLAIREANMKKISEEFSPKTSFLHGDSLLKLSYKRTDAIICQSKNMAEELIEDYHVDASKIVVINNPISEDFRFLQPEKKHHTISYITIGRLHKEKGHIRILKALSQLDYPFRYTIIGCGEELGQIKECTKSLGLEEKVHFINHTHSVANYLSNSDLYLQGSYAEGFPNALLESCAVGTPAIAFESPGGTGEIIEPGVNGFIASDEENYVQLLQQIQKQNPFDRKKVSESVFRKFEKSVIVKKYETLFYNLTNYEN